MHSRSEWTSRPCPTPTPAKNVPYIFVHHEGGGVRGNPTDKPAVLREIEGYVLSKGYVAIDYSLMVFQDGSIWEGRGLDHEDAATLQRNAVSVSVCAVGNFEREPTTPQLIAGIAEACRIARNGAWAARDCQILGHRDAGTFSTSCPGANLEAQLPAIRTLAAGGAPPPPDPPPVPKEVDVAASVFYPPIGQRHRYWVPRSGPRAGHLCHSWTPLTNGLQGVEDLSAALGLAGHEVFDSDSVDCCVDETDLTMAVTVIAADGACFRFWWGGTAGPWKVSAAGR